MEHDTRPEGEHTILNQVEEGMEVFDRNGEKVGKVEFVHYGASTETEEEFGTMPATANETEIPPEGTMMEFVEKAFGPVDEINDTVKARLLQEGFIRIDSDKLFGEDRFVTSDQIASVTGNRVNLNVSEDDLITK